MRNKLGVDLTTESIWDWGEMTLYKNYWISSYALLAKGWGDEWYARGSVSRIEPSGAHNQYKTIRAM
jgi:hypothetical protein